MKQETDNRLIAAGGEHDIMHHLGGYHRCCLGDPMHLEFAGKNFCEMLGYQETELAELTGEVYTALDIPTIRPFSMISLSVWPKTKAATVSYTG